MRQPAVSGTTRRTIRGLVAMAGERWGIRPAGAWRRDRNKNTWPWPRPWTHRPSS